MDREGAAKAPFSQSWTGGARQPCGRWRWWCKHRDEHDADREGRDRYPRQSVRI